MSSFDTVSHEWLVKFIEHRIADKRMLHLIQKWLKVGVLEDGVVTTSEMGTGPHAEGHVFDMTLRPDAQRGLGKPETFNFLGFTHICGKSRRGKFLLKRRTRRDRMRGKLREIKEELRRRSDLPIPEQGKWLGQVVRGFFAYHASCFARGA